MMDRLVHQNSTAFATPRAAPRVRFEVLVVPPAGNSQGREGGRADPARANRLVHTLNRRVEASLAHGSEPDTRLGCRADHRVAVCSRRR